MSTLVVQNLRGVTSSGGLINVHPDSVVYSPGSVIQVASVTKTDTFSTTTTLASGGSLVTGLSVTITPKKLSSKLYVYCVLNCAGTSTITQVYAWLARGATKIGAGDAASSRIGSGARFYYENNAVSGTIPLAFLDSPASTTAVTYNVYVGTQTASGSAVINRTISDTDNNFDGSRTSSTLTVMEIAV